MSAFILWLIVISLLLAFTISGLSGFLNSPSKSKETKNDLVYSSDDINIFEQDVKRISSTKTIDQNAVKFLISNKLHGKTVNVEDNPVIYSHFIGKAIEKIKSNLNGVAFTENILKRIAYSKDFKSTTDFLNFAGLISIKKFNEDFFNKSVILSNDILESYKKPYKISFNFKYVDINSNDISSFIKVTKEECKNYYDENKKDFINPIKYDVDYFYIKSSDFSKLATDEEIKEYYEDNKHLFVSPKKVIFSKISIKKDKNHQDNLKIINDLIGEGKTIFEISKIVNNNTSVDFFVPSESDDPIDASDLEPNIAQEVDTIEIGSVSDEIKTKFSSSFIEVHKIFDERELPLQEVSNKIQKRYSRQLAKNILNEVVDTVSDAIFSGENSIQKLANEHKIKLRTVFNQHLETTNNIFLSRDEVQEALKQKGIIDGDLVSSPIKLSNDKYVVLKISKIIPKSQMNYSIAEPQVKRLISEKKSVELVNKIAMEIENGNEDAMKDFSLTWIKKNNVNKIDEPKLVDLIYGSKMKNDEVKAFSNESNSMTVISLNSSQYLTEVNDEHIDKIIFGFIGQSILNAYLSQFAILKDV